VLDAAAPAGLDPIIHVSSYVALLPTSAVLGVDSPVGEKGPAYPRSKAESELIARRHQAEGVPVVTTYPGAVMGPDDPYFGDSAFTIAMTLRNRVPFALAGGWPVADVRTSVLVAVAVTLAGAVAAAIPIPNQPPDTACIELHELTPVQLSPHRP
jgi:nucleoside-diphosphate-sugar epimerase